MDAIQFLQHLASQYHTKPLLVTNIKTKYFGKPKQCFNNSFRYLMLEQPQGKYILGYIIFKGVPIEHAWVKVGNQNYDVTLKDTSDIDYYQFFELDFELVSKYVKKLKFAPSIYDYVKGGGKNASISIFHTVEKLIDTDYAK